MSPALKQKQTSADARKSTPLAAVLRTLAARRRVLAALAVLLAAVVVAPIWVWSYVRDRVLAGEDYQLTAEAIDLTPPPAWIRGDVKAEALRGASLDLPISILQPDLVERLSRAFAAHPWIETVEAVRKRHPAQVEIAVRYRRPIAMVQLEGDSASEATGLVPIDASGTVLPSQDFSPLEASGYPRIAGISTTPRGSVGTRWGDSRVDGAARIVEAIGPAWSKLGLYRIAPVDRPAPDDASFDLFTRQGTRIHWGRDPASPRSHELPPADKIARLRQFVAEFGALDDVRPAGVDLTALK